MNYKDVIIGSTSHELVHIDEIELSARLGGLISILDEDIKQHIEIFNNNVTYRYAYVKVNFKYDDGLCCFDNLSVKSSSLSKVLKGSKEAILIAVTAGTSIDKLISKYEILNQSSAFYFDSIGSAAIESYKWLTPLPEPEPEPEEKEEPKDLDFGNSSFSDADGDVVQGTLF